MTIEQHPFVNRENAGRYCELDSDPRTGLPLTSLYVIYGTRGGITEFDDGTTRYHEYVCAIRLGSEYELYWDPGHVIQRLKDKWIWEDTPLECLLLDNYEKTRELGIFLQHQWK